jgi:group I intron endonuclease
VRAYSTFSPKDNNNSRNGLISPVVVYEDAYSMKKEILNENKGKAGIYKLTNKLTGDIYVGQSRDLGKRFTNYFNLSYINRRKELIISRALIKYGYSNFSVTILEYCNESDLDIKEQYYFDTLNPKYNIQKIAGGSSKGLILSAETKEKFSKALKGVGEKAY